MTDQLLTAAGQLDDLPTGWLVTTEQPTHVAVSDAAMDHHLFACPAPGHDRYRAVGLVGYDPAVRLVDGADAATAVRALVEEAHALERGYQHLGPRAPTGSDADDPGPDTLATTANDGAGGDDSDDADAGDDQPGLGQWV